MENSSNDLKFSQCNNKELKKEFKYRFETENEIDYYEKELEKEIRF